jgi:hypothetical protein
VRQTDTSFRIKRENIPAALAAIRSMADSNFHEMTEIDAILDACRWGEVHFASNGDIDDIRFQGEKLGDEKELFFFLAPFVEHGSYIEMVGEDDTRWRWVFWRGELREEYPRMVWDYESMTPVAELMEGVNLG